MIYLGRLIARRIPTPLLVLGLTVTGLARLVWALARRWWLATPLVAGGCFWALAARHGPATVAAVAGVVAAALLLAGFCWSRLGPDSFARHVVLPVRSLRRRRYYTRRWDEAMAGAGLVRAGEIPVLMVTRGGAAVDELLVHMAPGQLVTEWRDAAPRLATALEVRSVRVRKEGTRDVRLLVRHRPVSRHEWPVDVDAEVAEVAAQLGQQRAAEDQAVVDGAPKPTEVPRAAFPRRPS